MSENLHDIDKLFHDSLDGHEENPPAHLWDAIDNNLDKKNVVAINRKYNNLKRIAAVLVVLLTGALAWAIYSNNHSGNDTVDDDKPARVVKPPAASRRAPVEAGKPAQSGTTELAKKPVKTISPNHTAVTPSTAATVPAKAESKNPVAVKQAVILAKTKHATNPATATTNGLKHQQVISRLAKSVGAFDTTGVLLPANSVAGGGTAGKNKPWSTIKPAGNSQATDSEAGENIFASGRAHQFEHLATENKMRTLPGLKAFVFQKGRNEAIIADGNRVSQVKMRLKKPAFSLMPFFTTNLSFNRLEADHHERAGMPPRDHDRDREEIKHGEQHRNNYAIGVQASVPLGGNWMLQPALSYLVRNIDIEPKHVTAEPDNFGAVKYRLDCSAGYVFLTPKGGISPAVGDSAAVTSSTNSLQYVSLPVAVAYKMRVRKFNIIPSAGAGVNFLVKQKIETALVSGASKEAYTVTNILGLKKTYFNALASLALEYNLSRLVAINLTPCANFALGAINKNAAVKSYPNSFSMSGGIKLNF